MVRILSLAFLLLSTFTLSAAETTQVLRLSAAELFARGSAYHTQLSADGKAIELTRGVLVENDGAAAGYSYQPNEEILSEQFAATKHLHIDSLGQPRYLLDGKVVERERGPGRALLLLGHSGPTPQAKINDQEVKLGEPLKAGNYWKAFEIPHAVLKQGKNIIQLSGSGKLWIARYDDIAPPPRKALPAHSLNSWKEVAGEKHQLLGPQNNIAGEYYVRLYLDGYLHRGRAKSPYFDAADLLGDCIPPADVEVKSVQIDVDAEGPDQEMSIHIQGASSLLSRQWGGELGNAKSHVIVPNEIRPELRYFGVAVEWHAVDGSRSPRLNGLKITTQLETNGDWGKDKLKILSKHNPDFTYNDHQGYSRNRDEFAYEDLEHPRLAELRNQYGLDEVVKGCTTDLQRMEKLAVWTSQQWTKGHLGKIYPKWDALEILKKHEDGTPIGGFCQQYNIVFLQACESFGMVGRCVSIGAGDHGVKIRSGHEVVEIWSNELSKWVYVDGQAAWYFVDKETRTPLNLLELRERQLAAIFDKSASKESKRAVEVVVLAKSPYEWKGLQEWPAFTELRMIPHTKFLDGIVPLPLNQGMRGWFWTGHQVWTDELYPPSVLYGFRVTNATDWNCPVNQTHLWLQQNTPGQLVARMTHNMPGFDKFVSQIDDQEARAIDKDFFTWPLRAGENRLQVQAVNVHGIRGSASWIKVEYKP